MDCLFVVSCPGEVSWEVGRSVCGREVLSLPVHMLRMLKHKVNGSLAILNRLLTCSQTNTRTAFPLPDACCGPNGILVPPTKFSVSR